MSLQNGSISLLEIFNTVQVTQITQTHIDIMTTLLNENRRAEVYIYYSKLIGNQDPGAIQQLMLQQQITTYSGAAGGSALEGNFNAKVNNQDIYPNLDDFSHDIILGMIVTLSNDVENGRTGILNANQIQQSDQNVWNDKELVGFYPGNIQLSWDYTQGTQAHETSKLYDFFIVEEAARKGMGLGKRIGEFSHSEYSTRVDDGMVYKINNSTGIIEGAFPTYLTGGFNSIIAFGNDLVYSTYILSPLSNIGREELWKYMGANGKSGVSVYDSLNGLDPDSQEFTTASDNIRTLIGALSVGHTIAEVGSGITHATQDFFDAVDAAIFAPRTDPLIIDLAGNGIALDSFAASNALFDLNSDGTPENTGWTRVNSDDSFLVIDKNNNGNIDDITEMFGSATTPGFVELKKYDSNGDNLINSTDSQFSLLKLWNDANANGVVDAGELTNLAQNNITEISLNSYARYVEIEGNLQTAISSATVNGAQRDIHELSFAFETPVLDISTNPDLNLPSDFNLSIESIVLPYSRGYRTLHSWQAAMTLDPTLLAMAQDMMQLTSAELYKINDKFEDFLFRWAGVENVTDAEVYATGSSNVFDARKVAFMEKITGVDFLHLNGASVTAVSEAWDLFFNDFLGRFLAQGNLHAAFPNASYDFATDKLIIGSNLDEAIANIESFANSMDLNSFVNFAYYSKNILELNKSQFADADFDAKVDAMLTDVIGAVDVAGFAFDGRLNIGGNHDDVLTGAEKNDVLNGQDGNDQLFGFAGNDYIVGGKGDDYLNGEAGNDIYRFSKGDGQDTIEDGAGIDKILLGDGITLADLSLAQVGNDIVINIGADDKIAIKNFYVAAANRAEKIEFADGSSFSLQNIGAIVYGDDFANTLNGTANNDIIYGLDGNDTIAAGSGNDTINGDKGNDIVDGNSGNDSYIFNLGDGQDTITDIDGIEQIIFGAGIVKEDIQLISDYVNNQSLIIKIGTGGEQITVRNFFRNGDDYKIETLKFADGSILNLNGITLQGSNSGGETLFGTSYNDSITGNIGNDTIFGSYGDDTITGGKGNDLIEGGYILNNNDISSGNDTFIFNIGDGQDIITDYSGNDQIVFGVGINQSDIKLISDYANNQSLIIKVGTNGDQIVLKNFFLVTDNTYKVETLKFADGSVMDLSHGITLQGINSAGEILAGTDFADNLTGAIGNDTITSFEGNDTITGGKGNDTILGLGGNDTYIFNIGDGQDTITDNVGSDQIIFGAGISQSDIQLISDYANSQSLIIKIGTNGDQIRLKNFFLFNDNNYKIETLKFADGSTIDLTHGIDLHGANISGEIIVGTASNDTITGNIGNDTLLGNGGDDLITGGKGNDSIDGGNGNDIYIFNIGDGQDLITGFPSNDQLVLGDGITQSDIQLISDYANNESLIVKVGNNGDQIRLSKFFGSADNTYKLGSLKFVDGSTIDLLNGISLQGNNIAGETLQGTSSNDSLTGNIGNDTIYASDGDDFLTGDRGNDSIEGSFGNDTYIFNKGDGQDIYDDFNGNDQIVFGSGINKEDMLMEASGVNLVVKFTNSTDQITINNFFAAANYRIETLKFNDGSTASINSGLTINGGAGNDTIIGSPFIDTLNGAGGNDYIYGSDGDDNISGGTDNDILKGASGNDSYNFDSGYGSDVINEESGSSDKIVFGAGIDSTAVSMLRISNDLQAVGQGNPDSIVIRNFFANDSNRIEYLQFADGIKFNMTNVLASENDSTVYSINGYAAVNEDVTSKIKLLNHNDNSNDYNNINVTGAATHGSASVNINGDLIYTSANNYNGADSFVISYVDAGGLTHSKTINVNVLPENDAPVALDKSAQTNEDTAIDIFALTGATDSENNTLSILSVGAASHGNMQIINDKITYTPTANFFGNDAFTYTISDGNGGFDTKTINVNVLPVNDTPVTTNDTASTNEETSVLVNILGNDSDVEDGFFPAASITITTQPASGTVAVQSTGKLLYTPNPDYYGQDSFTYTVTDSGGLVSNKSSVSINVINVNDAPKFIIGSNINFTEDTQTIFNVHDYFYDPDGDALSIVSVSALNGTMSFSGEDITYTPNANYNGVEKLTVTLRDSFGATIVLKADAMVAPVNDTPVAVNDSFAVLEDTVTRLPILDNDSDIDGGLFASSITNLTPAAHGTLAINPLDGSITYTPNANYNGPDSFTYTVTDSGGLVSNIATATINVAAVNDAPVVAATIPTQSTNAGSLFSYTVPAGTFTDADGDTITYSAKLSDGNVLPAWLTFNPTTRTFSGTSPSGSTSSLTIALTASDGTLSVTHNFALNITSLGINGTAGNDIINGTSAADVISALAGDDIINGSAGADTIDGGTGIDTMSYTASAAAVTVNLALATAQSGGDAAGDKLSNIENVIGSAFADTLTALSAGSILIGGAGNDKLNGAGGNDIFIGGTGADTINGGAGIDTIIYATSTSGVTVNLALTTAQSGGEAAGDIISNIENIIGSVFNDTLTGNGSDNILAAGNGNDKLAGGAGNDILIGGAGADKLDGAAGVDTVSYADSNAAVTVNLAVTTAQVGGYAAGDTLFNIESIIGSAYNDTLTGSSVANKFDGGAGTDTVSYSNSTAAVTVNLGVTTAQAGGYAAGDTLVSIENIIGSSYNDTLTGSSAANIMTGGAGADKLDGAAGVDTVSYAGSNAAVNVNLAVTTAQVGGHAAGDTLFNIENIIGSSYNDTLKGTSIANIITGGLGNDKMTGGAGADVFKYSAITDSGKVSGARDIITDFVRGTDKIDLGDFAGSFAFKGTGALGGSVPGVNYAQVSGNTIIGIDADGNGTLDMQIQLTGLHALTASDFLL
jgi:Ca2+-binding RTX toxin-like protein